MNSQTGAVAQPLASVTTFPQPQPLHKADGPSLDTLLQVAPQQIQDVELKSWDPALFAQELVALNIAPLTKNITSAAPTVSEENVGQIEEGTWGGTQVAVTDMFDRIEHGYTALFMALGVDTSIPQIIAERAKLYSWSDGSDNYPPHLDVPRSGGMPAEYNAPAYEIFNVMGLAQSAIMLQKIVPKTFLGTASLKAWSLFEGLVNGRNDEGATMAALEANNRSSWGRKTPQDIMQGQNIGDKPDWWSDARFAQQSFTGTNPATITLASSEWIDQFKKAAGANKAAADFLSNAVNGSLYIQDCSYFRQAVNAKPSEELRSEDRYCAATVTLFHLPTSGQLHPIAIIVDWKGSIADSVTIFNQRLSPLDVHSRTYQKELDLEKNDWPWRFAKTCAQQADWIRHEITVHLVNTHMIEEVIIVAANRAFDVNHPVFKLLEPHWFRTLPLNAAARDTLVPKIILDLVGLNHQQSLDFIKHAFSSFDFQKSYIPVDLPARGFPVDELHQPKFRNYPYARNMIAMWSTIRKFVVSMLKASPLNTDDAVANDTSIRSWCHEVQVGGQVPSFPSIGTFDQLVDAITMCIHIASPQHTAVNYLQNFYHGFVPSKPAALYQPLPTSLTQLQQVTEKNLLRALPVGHQRDWLLATQIPWLLSFKTADNASLLSYANSLYNLVRKKSGVTNQSVLGAATELYNDLRDLTQLFKQNSDQMTDDTLPYIIMNPLTTAVSILI